MDSLNVKNFGPIKDLNVSLEDLTLLIGPQASGKRLFLELFKLVNDHAHILSTLQNFLFNFFHPCHTHTSNAVATWSHPQRRLSYFRRSF